MWGFMLWQRRAHSLTKEERPFWLFWAAGGGVIWFMLKYAYIWHLQAQLWMLLIFYLFTFKCNKYKEFDGTNLLMNLIILCELVWNFTNEGLISKISKSKLVWEIIKKEEIVMFHVVAEESTRFDKGRETFFGYFWGVVGWSHDSC